MGYFLAIKTCPECHLSNFWVHGITALALVCSSKSFDNLDAHPNFSFIQIAEYLWHNVGSIYTFILSGLVIQLRNVPVISWIQNYLRFFPVSFSAFCFGEKRQRTSSGRRGQLLTTKVEDCYEYLPPQPATRSALLSGASYPFFENEHCKRFNVMTLMLMV